MDITAVSNRLRTPVKSGMVAGLLSLAALALRGRMELRSAAAPLNAPSQWVWGDPALHQQRWSLRYTLTGIAIHQASALMWGVLHHARPRVRSPMAEAALTTAAAAFTDLALTPRRFTPGFDKRLSPRSLAWVYGLFAVGLALSSRPRQGGTQPGRR